MRYWLGVVSKEYVQRGVLGGFAQICHGKKAPLAKLTSGDRFIYYSPKLTMDRQEPCKCFTAVGLEFTQSKNWGMQLRKGILEISKIDFFIILREIRQNYED